MTADQIRKLHDAIPFRPFVMHLADGRSIPVQHPDFVAFAPSGRNLIVYQKGDDFNIVDLLLVTDLEVKRGNGSRRRMRTG
jgi:hypothetical protein